MRIDKLEQMVYALDLLIDRYKDREQNPKCQCCGEEAEYVNPKGYLCYTCAATIASMFVNKMRIQANTRDEDVNPIVYNFMACLEACDIKPIDAEESNDEN